MSAACDRFDPSDAAKEIESDGGTVAEWIPPIPEDNSALQLRFVTAQIAQAPRVDPKTALFIASIVGKTIYYQEIRAVKKQQRKKKNRYVANYHNSQQAKALCPRPDVNSDDPTDLPLHDGTPESVAAFKQLNDLIKKFLIEVLGMHPDDWGLVKYYGFMWDIGAGMGLHSDYPTKHDKYLFFLRLIVSVGGSRTVKFSAHKFPNPNDPTNPDAHLPKAFDILTLKTHKGADAYLTSPFGNGKKPFCYFDEKRDAGLVAKHEVVEIQPDEERTANIIIDFPLRSMEAVVAALRVMEKETFAFDFDE